jgi:DNA (cytosine-5)-methyltransferase 1
MEESIRRKRIVKMIVRNKEVVIRMKLGTDCSGIESVIQALDKLKIKYVHMFSSEKDLYARESIKANYRPQILYEDITKRDIKELPKLDLYVCGFPCQPFSYGGNREGTSDSRSNIFNYCLKTIKWCQPKYFILENVPGLLTIENGTVWSSIIKRLYSIPNYTIHYKVLNTRDYGIPQNRERIYIVGIKGQQEFEWPKTMPCRVIKDYIDVKIRHKDYLNISDELEDRMNKSKATFLDLGWRNFKEHSYQYYTPTIMAGSNFWCVPLHRRATIKELLKLQGFPTTFKQVVSDTQMKKQIGNSMSVNVLYYILKELLKNK